MKRTYPSKLKLIGVNIAILISVFSQQLSGFSAGPCPPDCPAPLSTIPGMVNCNPNWHLEWDYTNTPSDTISSNASLIIAVRGGSPPYTWKLIQTSVQGRGFSLSEATTYQPRNTISTVNFPCGTAWIQVMDRCGKEVMETIRYPDPGSGIWVNKEHNDCVLSEPWTDVDSGTNPRYKYIYGGRYQDQTLTIAGGAWGYCPDDFYCNGWATEAYEIIDCLQTGLLPCRQFQVPVMYACVKTYSMNYREWQCIE